MKLDIPADIVASGKLTEKDCLIELGVRLYADQRITFGEALRLSGLDRTHFEGELARRDPSLYSVDDLHEDVETLRELGRL